MMHTGVSTMRSGRTGFCSIWTETIPDEVRTADNFIDGLLVGNEVLVIDDSAVESVSWARIKAALKY